MTFAKAVLLMTLLTMVQAGPASQAQATASIEGVVVKIGTNEPIGDVDLELSRIEGTTAAPMNPGAAELFSAVLFGNDPPQLGGAAPPAQIAGEIKYGKAGPDGRFSFTGLKEGKYRLAAVVVGTAYYPSEYGQHDVHQRGLPFPVSAGQAVKNLKLEMATSGTITGQIVDEDGLPLGHVTVMALSVEFRKGEPRWFIERMVLSDERGNYRLYWLGPGKYTVGAVYENPLQRSVSLGPAGPPGRTSSRYRATNPVLSRQVMPNGEVVEEAYGVVYHGGVIDPLLARTFDLHPGETFNGADVGLGAGKLRAHHLRGVVISEATGQPAPRAQVMAIPQRWSPNAHVLTGTTNASGVFDLAGAIPERYVLTASVNAGGQQLPAGINLPPGVVINGGGQTNQVGYLSVEMAGADIENIKLVANSGISVPGRVTIEGRTPAESDPELAKMNIALVRDPELIGMPSAMLPLPPLPPPQAGQPTSRPGNGQVLGSGDFTLYVSQGDFRLNVNGVPPNTYVKSIRIGGDDIQKSGLHILGAVPNPLQIVIGTDGGTVSGLVLSSMAAPLPNSVVALVPEAFDLRTRSDLHRSVTTDSNGKFNMTAVPPGTYKLFAWEWTESDTWQNPEFLRVFESLGNPVTLSASGKVEGIQLNAIPIARTGQ